MDIDHGRAIDWGKTSPDYAEFRPGPPDSFYVRLAELGIGRPGQRILDLGTGTGVLARRFAAQGATVAGIDISEEQVETARRLAARDGVAADLRVAPAERVPHPDASFDVITANQAWMYFDRERTVAEIKRLLAPGGVFANTDFSWLPRLDAIARRTEEVILAHNPEWTTGDWSGEVPATPPWSVGHFRVRAWFVYDEGIPFTRDTWRGRMRACRAIGASLAGDEVSRFDRALGEVLAREAPERFAVLHRINAHVYETP